MKKQVFVIHGGDSFKTHKAYLKFLKGIKIDIERYRAGRLEWKKDLYKVLGKDFEVFLPLMPNPLNAQYAEWKMWFKKFISHIKPGVILIGHSLGALFLAKYLAEENFPKKIKGTFLVGAAYSHGSFTAPNNYKKLEKQGGKIFFYHSKDDKVVPFGDLEKYREKIKSATFRVFNDRGHFNAAKIPELVKDIRGLYEKRRMNDGTKLIFNAVRDNKGEGLKTQDLIRALRK